jgi:hypothetical protein
MSLASWLTQTAYVASVTGVDQYGKPTYGSPVARKVRVELGTRMVTNARGEESPSKARLWCLQSVAITDRVWLPGADRTNAEMSGAPLAVSSVSDKSGSRTLCRVDI